MKTISTSAGFQDAKGTVVASGTLMLTLSQTATITATGGQVTTEPIYLPLDVNGKITNTQIIFNDELSPSGTIYYGTVYAVNGCRMIPGLEKLQYSITGASFDLATAVQSSSASPSYSGAVLLTPTGNQTITTGNLTLATGNLALTSGNSSIGGNETVAGTLGVTGAATFSSTINKVTITPPATSATLTIANGKIATVNNSLTLAGVDGTTQTFQASDTIVGRATTDILTNKSLGGTGSTTPNTPFNRLKATRGSALVAGDFSIGAGWGSTASIASVSGTDAAGSITILTGGTGIAANPSITFTFHDGTWTNPPIVVVSRGDVQTAGHVAAVTISATQVVFIVNTTPNTGQDYPIYFVCIGT